MRAFAPTSRGSIRCGNMPFSMTCRCCCIPAQRLSVTHHLNVRSRVHLDPVAIRYPNLRLILAHLGHPYEGECVVVIRKHANVYADISALFYRPFQLYNSLMLVQEYGVWNKVLFGTDYPFTTVNDTIAGVRGLNKMVAGTGLPRLNEDKIEELIHRDSLPSLGLT